MKEPSAEEWKAAADILQKAVEAGQRGDLDGYMHHIETLPDWAQRELLGGPEGARLIPLALEALKDLQPEKLMGILENHPHLQHLFPEKPREDG